MSFNPSVNKSPPKSISLSALKGPKQLLTNQGGDRSSKKLSVKGGSLFKQPAKDAANSESQTLATLTRSVRAINANPPAPTPESLQALYSLCEGYISANVHNAQTLYDKIRIELERKIGEVKLTLLSSADLPSTSAFSQAAASSNHETWLSLLESEWQTFKNQLNLIRGIFLHLDRGYVLAHKELLSIWDLGLDIFRHKIIDEDQISQAITTALLASVEQERRGTNISRATLSSVLTLLASLSATCFSALFVSPFLEASVRFYQEEAASHTRSDSATKLGASQYLQHVVHRLTEEGERAESVLATQSGSSLKGSILHVVETEMIRNHVENLVKGLPEYVEAFAVVGNLPEGSAAQESDLSRLYTVLARVQLLDKLSASWYTYVEAAGSDIVIDASKDDRMVDLLLDFNARVDKILAGPFRGNIDFVHKTKDAFEVFVNKRANKSAEMLAKYTDLKMRSGSKTLSDSELEEMLDRVLALFRYTSAKDLFEAFYMRLFAKRLLLNKSASSDLEKVMLVKLRDECGAAFTAKLETMAKDIDLSADLMQAYKQLQQANSLVDGCDLSAVVLTTGNWPSFASSPCALPESMVKTLDRFKMFYSSKHSGRTLTWQHSMDQCVLKAIFPSGKKELSVSLYQALVLLLFNGLAPEARLSFKEIATYTHLDHKEVSRTLQSLACGKLRVLSKHPKGRDVDPTDEFEFNDAFKEDKIRLKINQIQIKETVEENKDTTERVFVDRQNHIQLVIVRNLKSRKTMQHSALVMEVVTQLKDRFKVETSEIKKAIASLIDRDYMYRDEADQKKYIYIA